MATDLAQLLAVRMTAESRRGLFSCSVNISHSIAISGPLVTYHLERWLPLDHQSCHLVLEGRREMTL